MFQAQKKIDFLKKKINGEAQDASSPGAVTLKAGSISKYGDLSAEAEANEESDHTKHSHTHHSGVEHNQDQKYHRTLKTRAQKVLSVARMFTKTAVKEGHKRAHHHHYRQVSRL